MHFSHFSMMVAFAIFVSAALGGLSPRSTRAKIRYAAWSLALFLGVGLAIAWLMYPFSR